MSTHTPGPWNIVRLGKRVYVESSGDRHAFVCDMQAEERGITGEGDRLRMEADAQLITAAPAMLEALKVTLNGALEPEWADWLEIAEQLYAAIQQAQG